MITNLVETILPFPIFKTDRLGKIIETNEILENMTNGMIKNQHVRNVFNEWTVSKDGCIVKGNIGDSSCIFLKQEYSEHYFMYVGVFSQSIKEMFTELEALKKTNRNLDAVIESSFDGIYLTDREGTTIKTNSAIERITGIPKEYYIGKKMEYLMERGILESSLTKQVIKQKKSVSRVQLNRAGQETLLTGNPIYNDEGEIEGVVTNIRDLSELMNLQKALQKADEINKRYRKQIKQLKGNQESSLTNIVIKSEKVRQVYDTAKLVLNVDATVLITGQTGVGKDVLAKFIYRQSNRRLQGEFIKINCGAIPPDLLESELFGYEGGAFTGANKQGKPGMFELADRGVLFLDEIGELPLTLQVKLLRVIQEREVQRIGAIKPKKIDVRLIAATNRDLRKMVESGDFREDLFYRLHVIPISIPSLADRPEDILHLVSHYLARMNDKYEMNKSISPDLRSFLYHYDWPGNIRELSNLVERLVLLTKDPIITIDDLPPDYKSIILSTSSSHPENPTLKEAVEQAEKQVILQAVKHSSTTYELAKLLDTSQATVVRKLKKYKITLRGEVDLIQK